MNFGTGGSPRWPVCQKNFVLLLTDGEPCSDGKIPTNIRDYPIGKSPFRCVVGTNYQSCPATSGTGYSFPASSLDNPICSGTGVKSTNGDESGVEDVALFMHTNDLRNNPTIGKDNISGFQNITLYTVFAFGQGSTLLKYTAINGGFENSGPTEVPTTDLAVELGQERGRRSGHLFRGDGRGGARAGGQGCLLRHPQAGFLGHRSVGPRIGGGERGEPHPGGLLPAPVRRKRHHLVDGVAPEHVVFRGPLLRQRDDPRGYDPGRHAEPRQRLHRPVLIRSGFATDAGKAVPLRQQRRSGRGGHPPVEFREHQQSLGSREKAVAT